MASALESTPTGGHVAREGSSSLPELSGKLFLGGLSWETTEETLQSHFGAYGDIVEAVVMRDRQTSRPRGFGFVTFKRPEVADAVVLDDHHIDGRQIDAKKSVPQEQKSRARKVFVGGLSPETTEEQFRAYFARFGDVAEAQIMQDHMSGRSRGFGFITFAEDISAERVFARGAMHDLNGKRVEVKPATPKGAMLVGGPKAPAGVSDAAADAGSAPDAPPPPPAGGKGTPAAAPAAPALATDAPSTPAAATASPASPRLAASGAGPRHAGGIVIGPSFQISGGPPGVARSPFEGPPPGVGAQRPPFFAGAAAYGPGAVPFPLAQGASQAALAYQQRTAHQQPHPMRGGVGRGAQVQPGSQQQALAQAQGQATPAASAAPYPAAAAAAPAAPYPAPGAAAAASAAPYPAAALPYGFGLYHHPYGGAGVLAAAPFGLSFAQPAGGQFAAQPAFGFSTPQFGTQPYVVLAPPPGAAAAAQAAVAGFGPAPAAYGPAAYPATGGYGVPGFPSSGGYGATPAAPQQARSRGSPHAAQASGPTAPPPPPGQERRAKRGGRSSARAGQAGPAYAASSRAPRSDRAHAPPREGSAGALAPARENSLGARTPSAPPPPAAAALAAPPRSNSASLAGSPASRSSAPGSPRSLAAPPGRPDGGGHASLLRPASAAA